MLHYSKISIGADSQGLPATPRLKSLFWCRVDLFWSRDGLFWSRDGFCGALYGYQGAIISIQAAVNSSNIQQQLPLFIKFRMSSIEAIGIAGFRSYNPAVLQKIEFSKPLTLIWGPNGAGKTTIIEVMKYIMAGILPPSCQRGKNFLIDPRIIGLSDVKGEIRLKFRSYTGRPVMAVKRSILSLNNKGSKFESTQQILKTKDENGQEIEINHHCAEIQKQIPFLLGTSRAIIDKVMFCHQEESLWPFQDSSVLKTIFDELFETKKYTQLIEALWDQRKQLQKKAGEIKKQLPYLQRIYFEDKRKKGASLKQMEEVNKQRKEVLGPIRQKMQSLQAELDQGQQSVSTGQRIRLAEEKRSLEDKVKLDNQVVKKTRQALQSIRTQFQRLSGSELLLDRDQVEYYKEQAGERLQQLKKQREQLCKILQNIKVTQKISQRESDLEKEISAAIQFLPEFKKETDGNINHRLVLKRITEKKEGMENKIKKIKTLEFQQSKFMEDLKSKFFFEKLMSQTQFQAEKSRLLSDVKILEEMKLKILSFYFTLYKPIDQKVGFSSKQDDVSSKLQEVCFRIKMKKQELEKYNKMPREIPIGKRIDRLQFAGIEFYDNYIQYSSQKKKCSFCSKTMNEEQLRTVIAKCHKIKQKSEGQIRELRQKLQKECASEHLEGDPSVMISKISAQIESLLKLQKNLTQRMSNYEAAMKCRQQRRTNENQAQGIKIAKIEREVETGSARKFQKYSKDATIQLYSESVGKYVDMSKQMGHAKRRIQMYQQQQVGNKQKQRERERTESRVKSISDELASIREQTKLYQIIARTVGKLDTLLKDKQKMSKFKHQEDKSQTISTQSITQQLGELDRQIKMTELKTQFYRLEIEEKGLTHNCMLAQKQIQGFEHQIQQMQALLDQKQKKQGEYVRLKAEYDKSNHNLLIRADIAFEEYKRGSEKEYLIKKSRLLDAENASKDIQTYCRVVQNTISKIHQEKMDQINKILSDIWREIYNEKDISSIQIETLINEDSKKRRNYHYSIVMYRLGSENIKLEMRGRCSMGQKVLASLVIRMALAEVFASSARFLALDEPTTNLDQAHIDSLAQQLIKIIEMNEGGSFQMVIITHDMELIRKLEKYTNHFYEVNRNAEKFSVITKKQIGELYKKF